jgi:hypothetical protein
VGGDTLLVAVPLRVTEPLLGAREPVIPGGWFSGTRLELPRRAPVDVADLLEGRTFAALML